MTLPGGGICKIIVTKKNEEVGNTVSFLVSYGAPVFKGYVNAEGELNISDVVLLQKWLLAVPDTNLLDWSRVDMCRDGRLDVFDICLMKKELISQNVETNGTKSIITDIRNGMTKDEVLSVLGKGYTAEEEKFSQKYAYYYPVKTGEVFDTDLEGEMFVEFDLETELLVNYGYALDCLGTTKDRIYSYNEEQLKTAYDKIYAVMTDWYGE